MGRQAAGVYFNVAPDQEKMIVKLVHKGEKIACIARSTGLSRPTVYPALRNQEMSDPV